MIKKKQLSNGLNVFKLLIIAALLISSCKSDDYSDVAQIDQSGKLHPWTNLEWNNNTENFQFAIVTDRNGGNRAGVFEQGIEKFNLLQPEFVISVGDLIGGYTEDTAKINKQWDEFDALVAKLEMPFFYVPGNHDLTNQVQEDIWKERLGPTYFHFVYHDVLFLALNGEEGFDAHETSFYSEEQREYIRKVLADNADVRWTLVFMHKPIWAYDEKSKKSGWLEIEDMLKDRKHTVFAGHNHSYMHYDRNNSSYIQLATTGGGSGLRGPIFGEFDQVVWVTMTDEGPVIANLLLEGIWDEDFGADDVQKYLELTLSNFAVAPETELDEEKLANGTQVEYRIFNKLDIPMKLNLEFNSNEYFKVNPLNIERDISPNSVEIIGARLKLLTKKKIDRDKIEEELDRMKVKYTITYDFEKYGKIVVKGSENLLNW